MRPGTNKLLAEMAAGSGRKVISDEAILTRSEADLLLRFSDCGEPIRTADAQDESPKIFEIAHTGTSK